MNVTADRAALGRAPRSAIADAAPYIILVVVVAHAAAAWLLRNPGFGWGEDDVGYLLLGQQLRHFSYREVQDVLEPIHARFPPVFPAMLAVFGAVVGDRLDALQVLVASCSAGSIFLLYDATRRVAGEEIALLASVLYAVNPSAIIDGGLLMAEAPFKLFVMLALWALAREEESRRYAVLAGAATCLAALTRSAGVVFVVALFVYWVLSRRFLRAFVFGVVAMATVGAWLGYTFAAPDPDDRRLYVADLGARGRRAEEGMFAVMLKRLLPRAQLLLTKNINTALAFPTLARTVVDNVFWLLVLLVFGTGGLWFLWRRWRAAALYVAAYIGLLLIWRYSLVRFVHPIVPLLLVTLLVGAWWVVGWGAPRARGWVVAALTLLIAYGALPEHATLVRRAIECDRDQPSTSAPCFPLAEREYLQLAQWVRDSTPSDAIFFVSKERAFYMHAARRSINQDRGLQEDSSSLGTYLRSRGVSFTTLTPVGVQSFRHNRLIARACRDLAIVRRFSRQTYLLRVRAANEPADPGVRDRTCELLQPWADRSPEVG